jgi:peroxiredoxin Q/BCP
MKPIGYALMGALVVAALISLRATVARAELLKAGQKAPDFRTQMVTADGVKDVTLSDFRGKKVVLYFYPKDFTPGCTKEACAFRDGYAKYDQAGIVLLGCSVDPLDKHQAFIKKYGLPFPLLLDPGKKIAKEYGVANGIPVLGLDRRITYVIGEDGTILRVFTRVDPSSHATQVLNVLGVAQTSTK